MQGYIPAIDQGTTSSRAILFDSSQRFVAKSQREFPQHVPTSGWDDDLCRIFDVPMTILPTVYDCHHTYGTTVEDALQARIPMTGIAGDQHTATMGEACFEPGMAC
jgi:glycerol kinase